MPGTGRVPNDGRYASQTVVILSTFQKELIVGISILGLNLRGVITRVFLLIYHCSKLTGNVNL